MLSDIIIDKIGRMRHRRGFGVHSPLAFSLIKRVLFPEKRYAFYADHLLDNSNQRRLIRLIGFLHPAKIKVAPDDIESLKVVEVCGNIPKETGLTLIIDTLPHKPFTQLQQLVSDGSTALYCRQLSNHELNELTDSLKEGLVITAKSFTIAVPRKGMPVQLYTV